MKTLSLLLLSFFLSFPAFSEQALILTEIEQLQEKVWYLQRDFSSQKSELEQQKKDIKAIMATGNENQKAIEQRLDALTATIQNQQNRTTQVEKSLLGLNEALAALRNEFNQQNATQLQQAEKSGTQEGLLQSLRDQLEASHQKTEQSLAEVNKQLDETRAQLATLQQSKNNGFNQTSLYLGGGALALAVVLTVGFILLNNKSKRTSYNQNNRPNHEL